VCQPSSVGAEPGTRSHAQHGRAHVFNPQHIGGVPSTFCRDPVAGCEDPATAIRRADAFAFAVSQKGAEDGPFWSAKASDYLRGYAAMTPRKNSSIASKLAVHASRLVTRTMVHHRPRRPRPWRS
jgi:hypothetical protein